MDVELPFGQWVGWTRACSEHALVTLVLERWGSWIDQPVGFFSNGGAAFVGVSELGSDLIG